ncbi:hypothetical protein TNCV_1993871 [Trichonephila clavipes]|nr:hypothetical protein TNCV_1993871 [Trichonephila clavipes]
MEFIREYKRDFMNGIGVHSKFDLLRIKKNWRDGKNVKEEREQQQTGVPEVIREQITVAGRRVLKKSPMKVHAVIRYEWASRTSASVIYKRLQTWVNHYPTDKLAGCVGATETTQDHTRMKGRICRSYEIGAKEAEKKRRNSIKLKGQKAFC